MRKNSLYRVVFLGIIAIIAAFALQAYYLWSAYKLRESEFKQQVQIALLEVANAFEEINQSQVPDISLVNQISSNYYVVNINGVIDAGNLEFLLQRELQAVGLNVDFEYGIYDCYTDKMVYGNYVSSVSGEEQKIEKSELPTYDEYIYYFGVRFPAHQANLLNSLGTVGALGIVMLLTILFFAYASWVLIRQQQLSEMQKDFINNMTHEFKTPLSTIKVASTVLAHAPQIQTDQRLKKYAHLIEKQNERLSNQVEKILQIARIERGRFKLQREALSLIDVLQETVSGVQAKVEAAGGELQLKLASKDFEIYADKLHFSGVIAALLDNAVKYTPKDPKIEVEVIENQSSVFVKVADNGIGIKPEHQAKVFEKFYRVSTGNVHDVKGFGLGLFYVKGVCKAHDFELSIDKNRKIGTAFIIEIPKTNSRQDSLKSRLQDYFFKTKN